VNAMLQDFFDRFNEYLFSHPSFLAKLEMLFLIKSWALSLLMGVFLVLIYREQRRIRQAEERKAKAYLVA
jgi:Ca2+/Na+ antiporter